MSIPSDAELLRRAYEEVQRLRAQLAQVNGNYHACRDYLTDDFDRANKAEAAIARVRELCDRWDDKDDYRDAITYSAAARHFRDAIEGHQA